MLWNAVFRFLLFWIMYEMLFMLMKMIFWLCNLKSKFLLAIWINKKYETFFKIKLLSKHKSWILILMIVFSSITRRTIIKSAKMILIWAEEEMSIMFIDIFWADVLIIDKLWDIWEQQTWVWTWRDINQRHFLAKKSDRWLKTADYVCLI